MRDKNTSVRMWSGKLFMLWIKSLGNEMKIKQALIHILTQKESRMKKKSSPMQDVKTL